MLYLITNYPAHASARATGSITLALMLTFGLILLYMQNILVAAYESKGSTKPDSSSGGANWL